MEREITQATCPEAVFGKLSGDSLHTKRAHLDQLYRTLARAAHPDSLGGDEATFRALVCWKQQAERKLELGTYGDRKPLFEPVALELGKEDLRLTNVLGHGLLTTVYEAELGGKACHVKVARNPSDNDLIEREFQALTAIRQPHPDVRAESGFYEPQRRYLPLPLRHFPLVDADGSQRAASVLRVPTGRAFTGKELRERFYPQGIPPQHVWWVFRRLLLTLWLAHLKGYAHGAVTPDHLLIYPEQHGLVLLDWTGASRLGEEHVPLVDPAWDGFAPPEVLRKAPASVASDIFMAAKTALFLVGEHPLEVPIRRFFEQCTLADPMRRPQDAERAHESFGTLLGKRVFAEWTLP